MITFTCHHAADLGGHQHYGSSLLKTDVTFDDTLSNCVMYLRDEAWSCKHIRKALKICPLWVPIHSRPLYGFVLSIKKSLTKHLQLVILVWNVFIMLMV